MEPEPQSDRSGGGAPWCVVSNFWPASAAPARRLTRRPSIRLTTIRTCSTIIGLGRSERGLTTSGLGRCGGRLGGAVAGLGRPAVAAGDSGVD